MNLIKRLYAFVTRRRLVWLKDIDGEVSMSVAFTDPWGETRAERYWPSGLLTVILLPGGTVEGCYVTQWKYADGKVDE